MTRYFLSPPKYLTAYIPLYGRTENTDGLIVEFSLRDMAMKTRNWLNHVTRDCATLVEAQNWPDFKTIMQDEPSVRRCLENHAEYIDRCINRITNINHEMNEILVSACRNTCSQTHEEQLETNEDNFFDIKLLAVLVKKIYAKVYTSINMINHLLEGCRDLEDMERDLDTEIALTAEETNAIKMDYDTDEAAEASMAPVFEVGPSQEPAPAPAALPVFEEYVEPECKVIEID